MACLIKGRKAVKVLKNKLLKLISHYFCTSLQLNTLLHVHSMMHLSEQVRLIEL